MDEIVLTNPSGEGTIEISLEKQGLRVFAMFEGTCTHDIVVDTECEDRLHDLLEKRIEARLSREIVDWYRQEGSEEDMPFVTEKIKNMNVASLREYLSQLQGGPR